MTKNVTLAGQPIPRTAEQPFTPEQIAENRRRLREATTKATVEAIDLPTGRLREDARADFWTFATKVAKNDVLDPCLHKLMCRFLEHGESKELPPGDYLIPTRRDLSRYGDLVAMHGEERGLAMFLDQHRMGDGTMNLRERLLKDPTQLNGKFRGLFMRIRPDSAMKEVLVSRGTLKTTVCTVLFNDWVVVRDQDERILVVMNRGDNAENVARDMQSHFERNDTFRDCYPEIIPPRIREKRKNKSEERYRWDKHSFDVVRTVAPNGGFTGSRETTVLCIGAESRLTSQHFTRIHFDDLVDDKSAATTEGVQKVNRQFATIQSLGVGEEDRMLYVGTPWDYGDPSQILLDPALSGEPDLNLFWCPVSDPEGHFWYPRDERKSKHPGMTARRLEKIRVKQERQQLFTSQYLLQPVATDQQAFRPDWWQWYAEMPKGPLTTVVSVDPAISEKKHGDYCAFVVVSITPSGHWYVRELLRFRGLGAEALFDTILDLNEKWNPTLIGIEAESFQKIIAPIARDRAVHKGRPYPPIMEVSRETRGAGSKEFRVKRIAPRVQKGFVHLPAPAPALPLRTEYQRAACDDSIAALISEGERFPRSPHDDVIDALAGVSDLNLSPEMGEGVAKKRSVVDEVMAEQGISQDERVDETLGSEW